MPYLILIYLIGSGWIIVPIILLGIFGSFSDFNTSAFWHFVGYTIIPSLVAPVYFQKWKGQSEFLSSVKYGFAVIWYIMTFIYYFLLTFLCGAYFVTGLTLITVFGIPLIIAKSGTGNNQLLTTPTIICGGIPLLLWTFLGTFVTTNIFETFFSNTKESFSLLNVSSISALILAAPIIFIIGAVFYCIIKSVANFIYLAVFDFTDSLKFVLNIVDNRKVLYSYIPRLFAVIIVLSLHTLVFFSAFQLSKNYEFITFLNNFPIIEVKTCDITYNDWILFLISFAIMVVPQLIGKINGKIRTSHIFVLSALVIAIWTYIFIVKPLKSAVYYDPTTEWYNELVETDYHRSFNIKCSSCNGNNKFNGHECTVYLYDNIIHSSRCEIDWYVSGYTGKEMRRTNRR